MAEKGILFSTPMVQAILRGEKTQTRRVLKHQPDRYHSVADYCTGAPQHGYSHYQRRGDGVWESSGRWRYPYDVGDRLWVRETYLLDLDSDIRMDLDGIPVGKWPKEAIDETYIHYKADKEGQDFWKKFVWRPSMLMPKWAARIWLEVTAVRVERLQAISEADAIAEGFKDRAEFLTFWDVLNAKRGYPAASNCWVGVNEFKREAK